METRLIVPSDAAQLAALHGASFGAAKWSLAQIAQSLALPTTQGLACTTGETIFGFIMLQQSGPETEILTFCVAPSLQRKGTGRFLLAAAIESARQNGAKKLFLEVASDNAAATSLYEKSGFKITGKRTHYYRNGTDAITYALDL